MCQVAGAEFLRLSICKHADRVFDVGAHCDKRADILVGAAHEVGGMVDKHFLHAAAPCFVKQQVQFARRKVAAREDDVGLRNDVEASLGGIGHRAGCIERTEWNGVKHLPCC